MAKLFNKKTVFDIIANVLGIFAGGWVAQLPMLNVISFTLLGVNGLTLVFGAAGVTFLASPIKKFLSKNF